MGNLCAILAPKKKPIKRLPNSSSTRKQTPDDALLQEQALAAAILFQQNGGVSSLPFDRSSSLRYPNTNSTSKKVNSNVLPRSYSTRARSLADPLLQPHQLVNQDVKIDELETNHFVLVHGGGFGAWCWYKTIALLEEGGYKVNAIDLTGSGIHFSDTNTIASLSEYVKPLTDFLEKLPDGQKVILVGHDFGGTCISYAMELFPFKVAKAIFLAAAMLKNGQSTLDTFSQQATSDDLMRQAQIFLYANGNNQPPTAINLDKAMLKDLLFNQSPSKDVALASVSMRPIPFAPVLEKVSLSDSKYGSVRRFYIETLEDNAIPITVQESMINASPPEQVLRLKGADHSPFFSKPQALHKLLVEISKKNLFPGNWLQKWSQKKQEQRFLAEHIRKMGRGVSCGGGQSSLGYLFGSGAEAVASSHRPLDRRVSTNSLPIEMQPPAGMPTKWDAKQVPAASKPTNTTPSLEKTSSPATSPIDKNIPAGIHSSPTNNYLRLDGQNCGNFITDRASTKVHSPPGGGSSLGYLFGGSGGK